MFAFLYAAFAWIFSSQTIVATAIRFVAGNLLLSLLSKQPGGPRLTDLRVQTSSYGAPIPRVYGEEVRITGNVVDKGPLRETHKKKGQILGLGGAKVYTYYADLVILLAAGPLPVNGLQRILANGKCIFDANAAGAVPSVTDAYGMEWSRITSKVTRTIDTVRYYTGSELQPVNAFVQSLHPGLPVSAMRGYSYVILRGLSLKDWGSAIPNLEFIIKPNYSVLRDVVRDLATPAGVDVYANRLTQTVHGYVIANEGSCWAAIEPLAQVYAFDLIEGQNRFKAQPRGQGMRTIIPRSELGAISPGDGPASTRNITRTDSIKWPNDITVTYKDSGREYQTNSQRAFRNAGPSDNKVNVEVPLVLTGTEALQFANRMLYEDIISASKGQFIVGDAYRWLEAADVIGIEAGNYVEPFRVMNVTRSPNTIVQLEAVLDDPLALTSDLIVTVAPVPDNNIALPGDTIFQPVDSPIIANADDDTGFYAFLTGSGAGWTGADLDRSLAVGSPYNFTFVASGIVPADIADATTVLPAGATDVWDRVSSVQVSMLGGDAPSSCDESDVLIAGANLAWIGNADGSGGEFIHFTDVDEVGSPPQYVLSNLLRGRYGTEYNVAGHGASERVVFFSDDFKGRLNFGPSDWNASRAYRAVSEDTDPSTGIISTFTNTGEGKRPLAPIHLEGVRNSTNDDILIEWVRRTRYQTPAIGGGATPLGETVEAYEVDVYSGATVIRTLTSATPSVNYDETMQTADGHTLGDPVKVDVYQMSDVRGRGHASEGTL